MSAVQPGMASDSDTSPPKLPDGISGIFEDSKSRFRKVPWAFKAGDVSAATQIKIARQWFISAVLRDVDSVFPLNQPKRHGDHLRVQLSAIPLASWAVKN